MFLLPVFDYRFEVAAPLRAVSDFHHDTRVLKHLTPPPVIIQMRRFDPLGAGSVSEFTMWFGLLPVNWIVVHSDVIHCKGLQILNKRGRCWRGSIRIAFQRKMNLPRMFMSTLNISIDRVGGGSSQELCSPHLCSGWCSYIACGSHA
jgi:hypothetical protein